MEKQSKKNQNLPTMGTNGGQFRRQSCDQKADEFREFMGYPGHWEGKARKQEEVEKCELKPKGAQWIKNLEDGGLEDI